MLSMLLKERRRESFSSKRSGELEGGADSGRRAHKKGHGSAVFPVEWLCEERTGGNADSGWIG